MKNIYYMTNKEKFKEVFGIDITQLRIMTEEMFVKWEEREYDELLAKCTAFYMPEQVQWENHIIESDWTHKLP